MDSLTTERLLIKTSQEEFAEELLAYYSRNRAFFEQYEPVHSPRFYTLDYQRASMRYERETMDKHQGMYYYVFRKEAPESVIGTISFSRMRPAPYNSTIFGYDYDHDHWNRRYASESLRAVVDDVFANCDIHRIEARVMADNAASIRILEKLGFVFEGNEYGGVLIGGSFRDHTKPSITSSKSMDETNNDWEEDEDDDWEEDEDDDCKEDVSIRDAFKDAGKELSSAFKETAGAFKDAFKFK